MNRTILKTGGNHESKLAGARRPIAWRKGANSLHGLRWSARPLFLSDSAFSIIEVMIAVLIVGATMTPIFFLFSRSTAGTTQTRDEALASGYASELLEFAQLKGYDDPLFPVGENHDFPEIKLKTKAGSEVAVKIESRFSRKLHVRIPPITAPWPYLYKILVVEVSWSPAPGQTRKVSMAGLLSKNKL